MSEWLRGLCLALAALLACCAGSVDARAGSYPWHEIAIVVPYAAGGGTDVTARLLAAALGKRLGARVEVRNVTGGGGSIGTSAVLHAAPDGYTLGTGSQGPLAILPHYGGLDYSLDDVDFLALIGRNLMVIAARPGLPYADARGLLAHARANPGAVRVGNSGAGGANHIAVEGFAAAAGIRVSSVPFPGAAAAIQACREGRIDAVAAHPGELLELVRAGQLLPLLVMEDARIPEFPEVPTSRELGVDFTWAAWKGLIAPKTLPEDVRAELVAAIGEIFADPAVVDALTRRGERVDYRPAAVFEALARQDSARVGEVIRAISAHNLQKP